MRPLSVVERTTRLAFDYNVCRRSKPSDILVITAHDSYEALLAGRLVSDAEGEAGRATFYRVEYRFPILTGPGTTSGAIACFDISGDGYPFADPRAWIGSRPVPWSPHVSPGGVLCIGPSWRQSKGRMLFFQLAVHCGKFLNCDELDQAGYVGWNGPAVTYWRNVLHRRPLNPGLVFPALPVEYTHGIQVAEVDESFLPVAPTPGDFAPIGGLHAFE